MLSVSEIGSVIDNDLQKVRDVIDECVKQQPSEIRESLSYYFSAGGKFLRPTLTLLSARAAAVTDIELSRKRDTILFASAVELVHNASLIHDDIMDGDRLRHNMKTLHVKYGERCAVLLGDVLHITVFDLLSRIGSRAAISMMTETIKEMCYGQMLDVSKKKRTFDEYQRIIQAKTGKLMSTACAGGALMSGASLNDCVVEDIGTYGMYAGMLYQMVDDYNDGDAGISLTKSMIKRTAQKSKDYLESFKHSHYKRMLIDFIEYVVSMIK